MLLIRVRERCKSRDTWKNLFFLFNFVNSKAVLTSWSLGMGVNKRFSAVSTKLSLYTVVNFSNIVNLITVISDFSENQLLQCGQILSWWMNKNWEIWSTGWRKRRRLEFLNYYTVSVMTWRGNGERSIGGCGSRSENWRTIDEVDLQMTCSDGKHTTGTAAVDG